MQTLHISLPNTCALVVKGTLISYVEASPSADIFAPDEATFTEYLTPDDAAVAALAIDPSYNVNIILGFLTLDPVDVSPSVTSAYAGDTVTLHCEYSCGDAPISYEWINPGGLVIPGATQSHLTLSNLTEQMSGIYTCNVSARNEKGQTGNVDRSFTINVYPTIIPGDDIG